MIGVVGHTQGLLEKRITPWVLGALLALGVALHGLGIYPFPDVLNVALFVVLTGMYVLCLQWALRVIRGAPKGFDAVLAVVLVAPFAVFGALGLMVIFVFVMG